MPKLIWLFQQLHLCECDMRPKRSSLSYPNSWHNWFLNVKAVAKSLSQPEPSSLYGTVGGNVLLLPTKLLKIALAADLGFVWWFHLAKHVCIPIEPIKKRMRLDVFCASHLHWQSLARSLCAKARDKGGLSRAKSWREGERRAADLQEEISRRLGLKWLAPTQ